MVKIQTTVVPRCVSSQFDFRIKFYNPFSNYQAYNNKYISLFRGYSTIQEVTRCIRNQIREIYSTYYYKSSKTKTFLKIVCVDIKNKTSKEIKVHRPQLKDVNKITKELININPGDFIKLHLSDCFQSRRDTALSDSRVLQSRKECEERRLLLLRLRRERSAVR